MAFLPWELTPPSAHPERKGDWLRKWPGRPWLAAGREGSPCLDLAAARLVSYLWEAKTQYSMTEDKSAESNIPKVIQLQEINPV